MHSTSTSGTFTHCFANNTSARRDALNCLDSEDNLEKADRAEREWVPALRPIV